MPQAASLTLRALEESDLEFLYALENDPAIWGVSDTLAPVSRHTLRRYLEQAGADFYEVRQLRLVICASAGMPVGTLDLFDFDPLHQRAGVGITILAAARRKGYARAALTLVEVYARQTLRLHQLYCTVAVPNKASLRLFRQAGFRRVGIRHEWLRMASGWQDAVEMQCLLRHAPLSGEMTDQ
ncbi:GNAT family N-acetyltransferase [Hymenobacter elongatus]|uniref:N-acetyltransferase n=1 Tax=Hymenobacter elongatus TaxID=877208 RepID=A0A4Z0PQ90_9BACT|nr:GNAT family N-acetyltransferase [Hymenobacter elongatus]TGE19860.1 N-acetyltransferase [Hymenobacter elongatus]